MHPSSYDYENRDYSFGQAMLSLRTESDLTQAGLADLLGVSRKAVVGWEAGTSYPTPRHLKHFIELCLQNKAFPIGREAEEIRALWKSAHQKVRLDEAWLSGLLSTPPAPSLEPEVQPSPPPTALLLGASGPQLGWGDAPEVPSFYGRESELMLLTDWLLEQHCQVVSVLGLGGIGKSALTIQLMHRVAKQFDTVIWRSLRDAPPCESLLDELLRLLAREPLTIVLDSLERRLNLLFEYLRARRVLLALDNLESVMEKAEGGGRMLPGYDGYGRLLRRAAETKHKSCLLVTSREKPIELAPLEGSRTPVRSIHLGKLDADACESLLQEKEVTGSAAERERLIERYGGNPLALKIVAPTIADLFGGEIDAFLEQGEVIFGSVRYLLQEQFARLSSVEESVMLWLAILREAVTIQELADFLVNPLPRAQILEALDTLRGRSLIERGNLKGSFTLQSFVLEYTTTRLIEAAVSEIERGRFAQLIDHALELANAKEYIRQAQARLIVAPILARLRNIYPEAVARENRLLALFEPLRGKSEEYQGYGPANLLALLRTTRGDLSGLDLHQLSIREANLQGVNLHDVNLAQATLRDSLLTEALDAVYSIAFSTNGTYWAAGDRQGQVRVWLRREQRLRFAWKAHHTVVSALAISADEQRLATGCWDGIIQVRDLTNGTLVWTSPSVDAVLALAFSMDARVLVSAESDGQIRIWDAASGRLLQTLKEHAGLIFSVVWSPDGKILARDGYDPHIRLWELAEDDSGQFKLKLIKTLDGHTHMVWGLAFSPDGRTLASASWDMTVRFWDVESGKQNESIPLQIRLAGLAWSQDGRYLAAPERGRAFWVWDVEQHKQRTTFYGNLVRVRALAFTPDSGTLVTANEHGSVQFWDMPSGQCIRNWLAFALTVHEVAWSPNSAQLASGGNEGIITIWDVAWRVPLHLMHGHKMIVWGVSWSPDGRMVASCSEGSTIRIWDVVTGACLHVLTDAELADTILFATAWSPDSNHLAVASYREGVRVYDMNTEAFRRLSHSVPSRSRCVEWSPNGRYLAGAGEGDTIFIWNTDDYSLRATLRGHRGMVGTVAWTADGTRLASGSWGHGSDHLLIWDTQSWKRIGVLDDPNDCVYGVAWSADDGVLVSAGDDGILRWWNPQNGECILSRQGHEGPVQSLRASPDGRFLASCGDDGAIKIWDLTSGEYIATLRRDRPYERLNITGVKGLTDAQKLTLRMMGAVEEANIGE